MQDLRWNVARAGRLTVALLLAGWASTGLAATVTWTDTTPGGDSWHDGTNWSSTPNVPQPADTAALTNGGTAVATADVTITNLQLRNASTLRVESGTFFVTQTGHDTVFVADSGGTSTVEVTGGTLRFQAGAMSWGRGTGNFRGRFSGGLFEHLDSDGAGPLYPDLRLANSSGSTCDVDLSGTARWSTGAVSIGYHTVVPGPSRFVIRDQAALNATTLLVGDSTEFTLAGGTLALSGQNGLMIGGSTPNQSDFVMTGGTLTCNRLSLGGDATAKIEGGTTSINEAIIIAGTAAARLEVRGGTVSARGWQLGLNPAGSVGTLQIAGGATLTMPSGSILYTGRWGRGEVLLGDAAGSGNVAASGGLYFDDENRGGTGLVRGWGTLAVSSLNWRGTNTGQVVADGYGTDRTLAVSGTLAQTYENTGDSGWRAVNRGKLTLPSFTVRSGLGSGYSWGEIGTDTVPDLVNSARFTFAGLGAATGTLTGALLAGDRTDIASLAGVHHIANAWEFDLTGTTFTSYDLTLRYDPLTVGTEWEPYLRLFHHTGGSWTDVTATFDPVNRLIAASGLTGFSTFAVAAVPEPALLPLLLLAAVVSRRPRPR